MDDVEAKNVQMIFDLYLHGKSVLRILKELEQRGFKSPTGKDKLCKRTIDVMRSNEKYTGIVRLLDSDKHEMQYVSENNNPAIISK
ncbi:MAG: recombinase family protein [Lachnotalea sp.]